MAECKVCGYDHVSLIKRPTHGGDAYFGFELQAFFQFRVDVLQAIVIQGALSFFKTSEELY